MFCLLLVLIYSVREECGESCDDKWGLGVMINGVRMTHTEREGCFEDPKCACYKETPWGEVVKYTWGCKITGYNPPCEEWGSVNHDSPLVFNETNESEDECLNSDSDSDSESDSDSDSDGDGDSDSDSDSDSDTEEEEEEDGTEEQEEEESFEEEEEEDGTEEQVEEEESFEEEEERTAEEEEEEEEESFEEEEERTVEEEEESFEEEEDRTKEEEAGTAEEEEEDRTEEEEPFEEEEERTTEEEPFEEERIAEEEEESFEEERTTEEEEESFEEERTTEEESFEEEGTTEEESFEEERTTEEEEKNVLEEEETHSPTERNEPPKGVSITEDRNLAQLYNIIVVTVTLFFTLVMCVSLFLCYAVVWRRRKKKEVNEMETVPESVPKAVQSFEAVETVTQFNNRIPVEFYDLVYYPTPEVVQRTEVAITYGENLRTEPVLIQRGVQMVADEGREGEAEKDDGMVDEIQPVWVSVPVVRSEKHSEESSDSSSSSSTSSSSSSSSTDTEWDYVRTHTE
ncbi:hypothetical protein FACS189472_11940 [Alphaproteobacteria bacterium]|nr:hypothetical protein FACS189472_11940 [Alphaproteobacteria bacterium]